MVWVTRVRFPGDGVVRRSAGRVFCTRDGRRRPEHARSRNTGTQWFDGQSIAMALFATTATRGRMGRGGVRPLTLIFRANRDATMASRSRCGTGGCVVGQVDLEGGQVEITHTIIRVKGQGLLRKPTKSSAGERSLGLPLTVLAVLRRRFAAVGRLDMPVFPDSLGGFRDPANTRRGIREARGEDALAWITSHNFRKTVATLLDSGDFTAREIAHQLGHARPSMTQDVYMGRKSATPAPFGPSKASSARQSKTTSMGKAWVLRCPSHDEATRTASD